MFLSRTNQQLGNINLSLKIGRTLAMSSFSILITMLALFTIAPAVLEGEGDQQESGEINTDCPINLLPPELKAYILRHLAGNDNEALSQVRSVSREWKGYIDSEVDSFLGIANDSKKVRLLTKEVQKLNSSIAPDTLIKIHNGLLNHFGIKILVDHKRHTHAYYFPNQNTSRPSAESHCQAASYLESELSSFYQAIIAKIPNVIDKPVQQHEEAGISKVLYQVALSPLIQKETFNQLIELANKFIQGKSPDGFTHSTLTDVLFVICKSIPADRLGEVFNLVGSTQAPSKMRLKTALIRNTNLSLEVIQQNSSEDTHQILADYYEKSLEELLGKVGHTDREGETATDTFFELLGSDKKPYGTDEVQKAYSCLENALKNSISQRSVLNICLAFTYHPKTPITVLEGIYQLAQETPWRIPRENPLQNIVQTIFYHPNITEILKERILVQHPQLEHVEASEHLLGQQLN